MKYIWAIAFAVLVFTLSNYGLSELETSGWDFLEEFYPVSVPIYFCLFCLGVLFIIRGLSCGNCSCDDGMPLHVFILIVVTFGSLAYVGYWGIMNWIWPVVKDRNFWSVIASIALTAIYTYAALKTSEKLFEDDLCCEYGGSSCCGGCSRCSDDDDDNEWDGSNL